MKKWYLKAIVQKVISLIPLYAHRANYFFQKYVTRGVELNDDYFKIKSRHLGENYGFLKKYHPAQPMTVLDIGTGWYPIVPLGYWLAGADHVVTYDVARLTDDEKVRKTLRMLLDNELYLKESYNLKYTSERKEKVSDILKSNTSDVLGALDIEYLVGDLVDQNLLPNNSVTAISSNNTLEHVDEALIYPLYNYLNECLQDGGIMSHFIDLTDHYAHMDSTISVYHFLKYSAAQWQLINNSIQPMNRWRWPQYLKLHEQTGFDITETDIWPYELEDLNQQSINQSFSERYNKEELAICHGYIVSQKGNDKSKILV